MGTPTHPPDESVTQGHPIPLDQSPFLPTDENISQTARRNHKCPDVKRLKDRIQEAHPSLEGQVSHLD